MPRGLIANRKRLLWFLGTLALSFLLLWHVAPTLDYYPILSDDEGQILSDARTISAHGRLGSDLYQGVWNTTNSLFISPPLQRILIAAAFRVAGESITTARGVTVISALIVLWSISIFAWRRYGLVAALAATFLLIMWRSYLGDDPLGLPFLGVARSARYDLTAVAFIWLSLLGLSFYLEKPTHLTAIVTGLAAGLATLTQFFGAFVIGVIVLALLVTQRRNIIRTRTNAWKLAAFFLVLVPFALSIVLDWSNFVTQTFVMKHARTGFTDPTFYIQNFFNEGARYREILEHAFLGTVDTGSLWSTLTSLVATVAACLNLVRRLRRNPAPAEWILPLSLVVFGLSLALAESTKAPLYAIVLYPSLCLALGVLWQDLTHFLSAHGLKLVGVGASLLLVAFVLVQYTNAFDQDRAQAAAASRYDETTALILDKLPPDAAILTSARLAWGLRELSPDTTIYLAITWQLVHDSNQELDLLPDLFERKTQYLVLDDAAFVDFASEPRLEAQFREILARCVEVKDFAPDSSYGTIHMYRLTPDAPTCR